MRQHVYLLKGDRPFTAKSIEGRIFVNESIDSSCLNLPALEHILKTCPTEYFFVISSDYDILFRNFDFNFYPESWDSGYVHLWNSDSRLRLYNKSVVSKNPAAFVDSEFIRGNIAIKDIPTPVIASPNYDIIYLSYDEYFAEENYQRLKDRFPRVKRVHGVKGIYQAHKQAALLAETNFFFVVDADAIVMPDFNFDYSPHECDWNSVHVWHSLNPVNSLVYGYGGVKLFPTQALRDYQGSPIDFTTSVTGSLKVIESVSNITNFNTDPFSAWRSGFRECVKLSAGLIKNQDGDTQHRLDVWCSKGADQEFGDFAIQGAIDGRSFGTEHAGNLDMLGLINDYHWLEKRFTG